jgi:hypothetical protein
MMGGNSVVSRSSASNQWPLQCEFKTRQRCHLRRCPRDTPYLRFAVREPFPSIATQTTLVSGRRVSARRDHSLADARERREYQRRNRSGFIESTSGISASISVADKVGQLVH